MKLLTDTCYDGVHAMDIFLPDAPEFATVIYFHGGGIEGGDKSEYAEHGRFLAEQGICFVSANYSLYPDIAYPAFIEDAANCVQWVVNHIGQYGSCRDFYVGGSSAGAYLSLSLCFNQSYLKSRGVDRIKGYIHNAGQPTAHYNVLKYSGTDSRRVIVDETAPLYYVGTTEPAQSMLILFCDNDMENRYEQSMLLLSTLKHFGYSRVQHRIFENMRHCEQDFAHDTNGENILARVIADYVTENEKN